MQNAIAMPKYSKRIQQLKRQLTQLQSQYADTPAQQTE
jgi:hypothetical protein